MNRTKYQELAPGIKVPLPLPAQTDPENPNGGDMVLVRTGTPNTVVLPHVRYRDMEAYLAKHGDRKHDNMLGGLDADRLPWRVMWGTGF